MYIYILSFSKSILDQDPRYIVWERRGEERSQKRREEKEVRRREK